MEIASSTGSAPEAAQSSITGYWDWRAPAYDQLPRHGITTEAEKQVWLSLLRGALHPAPSDVLDIGCGTGFLALLAAELGHRVTGVDLSEQMMAVARSHAAELGLSLTLLQGDAHDPPVPDESMDAVVNRHVLWTLLDPQRALVSWRTRLRPGGRLAVIQALRTDLTPSPAPDAPRLEWQERYAEAYSDGVVSRLPLARIDTIDEVLGLLDRAGFVNLRAEPLDALEEVEPGHVEGAYQKGRPRFMFIAERP